MQAATSITRRYAGESGVLLFTASMYRVPHTRPPRPTKTLSDAPPTAPDCNRDATGAFAAAKVSPFLSHTRYSGGVALDNR
jgi:hypothetical protein